MPSDSQNLGGGTSIPLRLKVGGAIAPLAPPGSRAPGDYSNILDITCHRRIQDFVRGGPRPSWPPGGGGPRPSWPAPHYLGEQYFVGRGGPRPPPLDPRMHVSWKHETNGK